MERGPTSRCPTSHTITHLFLSQIAELGDTVRARGAGCSLSGVADCDELGITLEDLVALSQLVVIVVHAVEVGDELLKLSAKHAEGLREGREGGRGGVLVLLALLVLLVLLVLVLVLAVLATGRTNRSLRSRHPRICRRQSKDPVSSPLLQSIGRVHGTEKTCVARDEGGG